MNRIKRKRFQQKNKKKELVLVFDENARREFLTGFHKRKVQRKTKAAEELEKQLKLERKKIKAQTKLMYENIIKSQKPIPEVSELLTKEIDMGEHCVSVTEISAAAAAKKQNWIGENHVEYHRENHNEADTGMCDTREIETIEGMEEKTEINNLNLKTKKDFKKIIKKEATQQVKKSKVFKTKSRVAQIKNKKRRRREEWKRAKQNKNEKKGKRKRK